MPHSDDFGIDDDDADLLAAATQFEASQSAAFELSPRPAKRPRLSKEPGPLDGADCAYYLPGELPGSEKQTVQNPRHKIHVPKQGGHFRDQIFSQTQHGLDSDPSAIRGPVWKKPAPPTGAIPGNYVMNGSSRTSAVGNRDAEPAIGRIQTTLNGLNGFTVHSNGYRQRQNLREDALLAARLQAEEHACVPLVPAHSNAQHSKKCKLAPNVSEVLANLPPDAFSSSPAAFSETNEVIMISSQNDASQMPATGLRGPQNGLKQMTIFGQPATQAVSTSQSAKKKHAWPLKAREEPPTHHQLDDKAMQSWVYPTNLGTFRDYQYNIVSRSLFHNTLVALPTGLGKTFIAATVMLNYYRWTKDAQIVFMAPTKPLIAQQMEACYSIVGIPRHDTVLMTGETTPAVRAEQWLEKRVFFMTPQTVMNDLKTGICDPKKIVLVVVDEAHKATGSYAYTEVTAFLRRFNNSFRIQALTATPGSSVEAVQAVIDNLGIARVELRTEQSLDIRQFTHEKHTDTQLFDYSDEQILIMEHFSKALQPVLDKLNSQNAYWSRDPMALSPFGLTTARQKWNISDAGRKAAFPLKAMVNNAFTVLANLAHSIILLKNHGLGPFYSKILDFQKEVDSGQSKFKSAIHIAQHEEFVKMTRLVRGWTNHVDFIGHPKLEYLREVVMNHFLDAGEQRLGSNVPPSATRVMIFASFRDSTEAICKVLKRNEPMIRPHEFVGQAASKGSEGMNQKRQNEVIQDFKAGKYNTLVATSIGEEGLDIGDVDLIVCYDASSSPIRMLQRIGRTGRKRIGHVVLLLMRGKEENDYAKAQDNYAYIQKSIADSAKYTYREDQSPRILPLGVQPVVDKKVIDIPVENSQPVELNEKGRRAKGKGKTKRPPKKFHMPDGVRTGFVKASKIDSDEEDESDVEVTSNTRGPAKKTKSRKATVSPVAPQLEPAPLPFLDDVLLNDLQHRELERKYAHTNDDAGDLIIRAPDAARFPDCITHVGSSRYVRHGRALGVIASGLRNASGVNDERIKNINQALRMDDLREPGVAKNRLMSPAAEESDELPEHPLLQARIQEAAKTVPSKRHKTCRVTSIPSTAAERNDPSPAATKKTRGRPKKKQTIEQSASYHSDAAEGAESSPEPTPANMRIGTQGIDLGSRDTSGEDEDEEPDSELDDFVVRSDQTIELASSSLPSTLNPRPGKLRGRVPKSKNARSAAVLSDILSESDSGLGPLVAVRGSDEEPSVEEVAAPAKPAPKVRVRKVIDESDSDE